jgi:hypothetical protein
MNKEDRDPLYARVRADILREGLIPSSNPPLKPSVWNNGKLLVLPLPFEDWEDEDGYNMMLESPTGEAVRVNSIDFDFEI